MKKIIIIVLALAIVLGFVAWKFGPNLFSGSKVPAGPVKLVYWGLWEEENIIKTVIDEYKKTHPDVEITYERKTSVNYRSRLQTQLKEGTGPDIFRIHNSWVPMFVSDIYPAPLEVFSISDFEETFYPVAKDSFVAGQFVYGAPIGIDGLAMYVNEDILSAAGVTIPTNWTEFQDSASRVTVVDQSGVMATAGAALGTASNVDHFSDILGLLLLQQGVNLQNPEVSGITEVLQFYTGFVTEPTRKIWDSNLPTSTQAFAQGRVAFYFAPSWRSHELRVINPSLKFKVVPVPQIPNRQEAWGSFWGETVSNKSKNPKEAWEFVKFLTSPEAEKLLYGEASKIRLFGEPYSRVDLAAEITDAPVVGAYVQQGPYYKTWFLNSNTFDDGINDEMIKYWEDGVNSIVAGSSEDLAAETIKQGVEQILNKYTRPAASPAQ
jgi:multiple sugar transport system substrate-binding protein